MKYVLLFCGTEEDAQAFAALSPDQLRARYAEVGVWSAEHRSKIGASSQLQGPETATSVRFGPAGPPVVTDGPFLEGHPALSREAQVALTLRTVCRLSTVQIAGGFLVSEPAIVQRLTRARLRSPRPVFRTGYPRTTSWPIGCPPCWRSSTCSSTRATSAAPGTRRTAPT